jgi:hypothetical protein
MPISQMNNSNAYLISDLVTNDPFDPIFHKYKDTIFYEYLSYRDYFNFLKIIGSRLKNNYEKYGDLAPRVYESMERQTSRFPDAELKGLFDIQKGITDEIQLGHESFVIFTKIFLGKLGLLVEKLVNAKTHSYTHSFTDHKEWFIKNNNIIPKYSELLIDLHWYDQFLCVMRDKIIEHSGALSTLIGTGKNGIQYRRKKETFGIPSDKDQEIILSLIFKYGQNDEMIKNVSPNPYMMLDDFMVLVLDHNTKLEKQDLVNLGMVVKNSGGVIDAVILAKHLRKFLQDAAALFV